MAKVNKKTLILILALATFTVCFLCGLAILIGDSEPTAELAQVSATATKTATETATETPQPTSTFPPTSEPPTATPTPEPTETPLPTSTATPNPTVIGNVLAVYFFQIAPYTIDIGDALGDLGDLLQSPDFDEPWMAKVAQAIVVIRSSHEKLLEIIPPVEVSYIHEALLDATQDCNDMTYHLVTSIENIDEQELTKANELMESCGRKAEKATRLVEDFSGK